MPFPMYSEMNFGPHPESGCNSTVYRQNDGMLKVVIQDFFGVGLARDMDVFFNSYLEFISSPAPDFSVYRMDYWVAEQQLERVMMRHGVCMNSHILIKLVPIRPLYDWRQAKVQWEHDLFDWEKLSS